MNFTRKVSKHSIFSTRLIMQLHLVLHIRNLKSLTAGSLHLIITQDQKLYLPFHVWKENISFRLLDLLNYVRGFNTLADFEYLDSYKFGLS